MQLSHVLQERIHQLIHEGFVHETKSGFQVTPLVHKLRSVLDISLDELSQKPPGAIWANPQFTLRDLHAPPPDVFVLMPFLNDLEPVYEDHIKSVAEKLNLSVARADDFFTTHAIIDDIWTGIYKSKVVVADCTGRNPNVFYEIGISHTLGKPVVLLSQDIADVPFDVQHRRCIVYDLTPRGMTKFEEILESTLQPYCHEAD